MEPPTPTCFRLRIIFSVIGVFVGLSVSIVFGVSYSNPHTAAWGALSGIMAIAALSLHIQYYTDKWVEKKLILNAFFCLGVLVQIGSVAAFIIYIVLGVIEKQALTPSGPRAFYLSSVWCFMSWKWSFLLSLYAFKYMRLLRSGSASLSESGSGYDDEEISTNKVKESSPLLNSQENRDPPLLTLV